jgi:hypothetical protein
MLALIFAVISLSSIDPDPVVSPAAALGDRVTAGTGFASGAPGPAFGFTSDITVAPACTYGVPQFGSSFWNDATSLSRTLTQPTCSSFGFNAPWLPQYGNGFVGLAPTRLSSPAGMTATFQAPLPARFTTLPATLAHGSSEPVLRARAGVEPIFAHAPSAATPATVRHH